MDKIKKVFLFDQNILIQDGTNKLWIMGKNTDRRTGFGVPNKAIYSPVNTGIILDADEEIQKCYAHRSLLGIYTTKGKLFISRSVTKNKTERTNSFIFSSQTNQAPIDVGMENELDNEDVVTADRISVEDDAVMLEDGGDYETDDNESEESDDDDYDNSGNFVHETESQDDLSLLLSATGINTQTILNQLYMMMQQTIPNITITNITIPENDTYDNLQYYGNITAESKITKDSNEEGFNMISDNVNNVLFISETLFFQINDKIFFYNKRVNPVDIIVKKKFGFSVIPIRKNDNILYQILLPFQPDRVIFCQDFIYLSAKPFIHVISAYQIKSILKVNVRDPDIITWIYFRSDEPLNENNIYFLFSEGTIYVKKEDGIYKYSHKHQTIEKFISNNLKTFFLRTNDGTEINLFCQKEDGIYIDYGVMKRKITYHPLLDHLVDFNYTYKSQFVLINHENAPRFIAHGSQLFFNIHGLICYKLTDSGLIYYDSQTLYYCTNIELDENTFGTSEIEKINLRYDSYYIYMFTSVPEPVTHLQITNQLILLQSGDKFYYHTINTDNFKIDKFTQIIINSYPSLDLVLKHHVVRTRKKYNATTTLHVNIDANKLDKLLNIVDMVPKENNFEIKFKKGTKTVSYGDGPKRQFLEDAIIEFSEKYLVSNNVYSSFNVDAMERFTDNELITIGVMLHLVICHSQSNLPIRLPLKLVSAIMKRSPTINELEYFAKIESSEAFQNAYKFKDDVEAIKDFGYDTYEECLRVICKYDNPNPEKIKREKTIAKLIAKGFRHYNEIKNLSIMNLPTLDYYLSGDYIIDRGLLIKNLKVFTKADSSINSIDFLQMIIDIIRDLPEEKLVVLLKNWTGTSVVKKTGKYEIYIEKSTSGVHFGTCNMQLTISENFITDPVLNNTLIDVLTTPYDVMVDPR